MFDLTDAEAIHLMLAAIYSLIFVAGTALIVAMSVARR